MSLTNDQAVSVAHKLEAVNATRQDPIEGDPAVAGTIMNPNNLLPDIAPWTANALMREQDPDADSGKLRTGGRR